LYPYYDVITEYDGITLCKTGLTNMWPSVARTYLGYNLKKYIISTEYTYNISNLLAEKLCTN